MNAPVRRSIVCALIVILIAIVISLPVAAQKKPGKYGLRSFKMKGLEDFGLVHDWIVTSKKSSIVIVSDVNPSNSNLRLFSIKANHRGKTSPAKLLLYSLGYIISAKAVWLEGGSTTPSAGQSGVGLLFVLAHPAPFSISKLDTNAKFIVARFDADGKLLENPKTLFTIIVDNNRTIIYSSLNVSAGPNGAGVTASFNYFRFGSPGNQELYGYERAESFFIEFDSNAKMIGKEVRVPIADSGNFHLVLLRKPFWNGSLWLIPGEDTRIKKEVNNSGNILAQKVAEDVMNVYTVKKGKSATPKVKKIKITSSTNNIGTQNIQTFSHAFITPQPGNGKAPGISAAAKAQDVLLFLGHGTAVPQSQIKFENIIYDFSLYKLNKFGKKIGNATAVEFPKMNHKINPGFYKNKDVQPNHPFSEFMPAYASGGAASVANNLVYVSSAYSLTFTEYGSHLGTTEYQYNLYGIDPQSGKVTHVARTISLESKSIFVYKPKIQFLNDSICVINSILETGKKGDERSALFSRFK